MNVRKALIIVLKHAQMMLVLIPALVILAIVLQVTNTTVVILMSVLWVQMDVHRLVPTLLETIHVPVILATIWEVMDTHVMVRFSLVHPVPKLIKVFVDIDECVEDISGCDQTCTNTIGSYQCTCDSGYRLASDSHHCNGK